MYDSPQVATRAARCARRPIATEAATPTIAATAAVPQRSRPEARPKLIAASLWTPSASRIAAVALTLAIAPPEAIGIKEAAAERQRTTSARGGEKPTPSAASSSVLPSAREVQQPSRNSQAAIASRVVERGWFTTRAASLANCARRATIGRRARWRPPTSRPQQQTPKRTTPMSGRRKLPELVAVAEIE